MKGLSALTGISDRTIRYYIDDGLFIPEKHTENYEGRRSYEFTENDVKRLKQIALLRKHGFSISEIKELAKGNSDINSLVETRISEAKQNSENQLDEIKALEAVLSGQPKNFDELCDMLSNPIIEEAPVPVIDEQSAYKPMYKKSKKRIKIIAGVALILALLTVLLVWVSGKLLFKELQSELSVDVVDDYKFMYQDYIHHLADGYCILRLNSEEISFVYYPKWRNDDEGPMNIEEYVVDSAAVYKYGLSKNAEWVYIHYYDTVGPLYSTQLPSYTVPYKDNVISVKDNVFMLYNIKDKTQLSFAGDAEIYKYCKDNGIVFDKFYYPSAHSSFEESRIYINDDAYISVVGDSWGESVVYKGEAIFAGYIEEYSIIDEHTIAFNLKLNDKIYFEYPNNANQGIVMGEKKVGKHKINTMLKQDVYYSEYIVYDFNTNTYKEYENRKDIEQEYDVIFSKIV